MFALTSTLVEAAAEEPSCEIGDLVALIQRLNKVLVLKASGNTPANSGIALVPNQSRVTPTVVVAAAARPTQSLAQSVVVSASASEAVSAPSQGRGEKAQKVEKMCCRCNKNANVTVRCLKAERDVDSGRCGTHKNETTAKNHPIMTVTAANAAVAAAAALADVAE